MLFVFFGCYRRPWLFSLSQAMTRGERSVKRIRRQNSNRTRMIAGSLSRSPPSYSKANLTLVPSVFVPLTSGRERTTLERSDLRSENNGLPVELRMPNVHCTSFRHSFNIILLVSSPNPEINIARIRRLPCQM